MKDYELVPLQEGDAVQNGSQTGGDQFKDPATPLEEPRLKRGGGEGEGGWQRQLFVPFLIAAVLVPNLALFTGTWHTSSSSHACMNQTTSPVVDSEGRTKEPSQTVDIKDAVEKCFLLEYQRRMSQNKLNVESQRLQQVTRRHMEVSVHANEMRSISDLEAQLRTRNWTELDPSKIEQFLRKRDEGAANSPVSEDVVEILYDYYSRLLLFPNHAEEDAKESERLTAQLEEEMKELLGSRERLQIEVKNVTERIRATCLSSFKGAGPCDDPVRIALWPPSPSPSSSSSPLPQHSIPRPLSPWLTRDEAARRFDVVEDALAPPQVWLRDPLLHSSGQQYVNVSFIFVQQQQQQQRSHDKELDLITAMLTRLEQCTNNGGEGSNGLVTSELLVSVGSHEQWTAWMELKKKKKKKKQGAKFFSSIIVFLTSSGNSDDDDNDIKKDEGLRAYNRLAAEAAGRVLVFLQSDSALLLLPEEGCNWLEHLSRVMSAWPRMGAVGLNTGIPLLMREQQQHKEEEEEEDGSSLKTAGPSSRNESSFTLQDDKIGVAMQFMSVVRMAPMAVDALAFRQLGGFNEELALMGAGPGDDDDDGDGSSRAYYFADYDLCSRMWLAGYQVALMAIPKEDGARSMTGPSNSNKSKLDRLSLDVIRNRRNKALNQVFFTYSYNKYWPAINAAVKQSNALLA